MFQHRLKILDLGHIVLNKLDPVCKLWTEKLDLAFFNCGPI